MRLDGWEERFHRVINNARCKVFVWGEFDCMIFAADVAKALTGNDPMADLRGAYANAREAYAVLNSMGGVRDALGRRLSAIGFRPIDALYAKRGDVLICEQQELKARVSVVHAGRAVGPGLTGLSSHEISGGARAWSC